MRNSCLKKDFVFSILVLTALLACNSIILPATPTLVMPVPEIIVLTEVLQKFDGCRSVTGVEAADHNYSFSCSDSADTGYTVSITRFTGEATAHAEFESSRGDNPVLCFHGYGLYETSSENPNNQYIVQEQLRWQAGQRGVAIDASYDYGYFHFSARDFSEAMYDSSLEHGLFPAGTCPTTGTASPLPALAPTSTSP